MMNREQVISVLVPWPLRLKRGMAALLVLLCVLAVCPGCVSSMAESNAAEKERAAARLDSALSSMVVMGASLSAGFGLFVEGRPPVNLADILDAALERDHGPISNFSNMFMFRDAIWSAKVMLSQAESSRPTLVIALDFLFWFGYGSVSEETGRHGRLAHGLSFLDQFDCPVIVGDLPDMSEAVGRMLRRSQVPSPAMLEALNADIQAWCAKRDNVILVSLADFMDRIKSNKAVAIGSRIIQAPAMEKLLQMDRLHPTVLGASGAAILALSALQAFIGPECPDFFCRNPEAVAARLGMGASSTRPEQKEGQP